LPVRLSLSKPTDSGNAREAFLNLSYTRGIVKVVEYTYLSSLNCWNLGFGDFNEQTGDIDDLAISDNGDGRKVIATVAMTLLDFFADYPEETVIFTGSTGLRSRIYQRAVLQYATEFSNLLIINGINQEGELQPLETEATYFAFLIKLNQSVI
jgi:hypothetical protein